jgi:hypothetical protein
MTVTDVVAVLGLVSGITGTVLGILAYLRDRARVEVSLQWDMDIIGDPRYDPAKPWGSVTVTNVGRRTVHVSHVALRLPDRRFGISHLLITGGIAGKTLPEGAPAEVHVVTQDGMEKFASVWHLIRAQVSDSTGRVWKSNYVREKPSWAKVDAAA